jgi:signal transduction histidine kinase
MQKSPCTVRREHPEIVRDAILDAREEERARIARDLHDQLGQQVTALRLVLEHHRTECSPNGPMRIDQALTLTREIDAQVDFLARALRPARLDDLGLALALGEFVRQWAEHSGVTAEFRCAGILPGLLPRDLELTFYRVAQEALHNVVKHARARRADILIEVANRAAVLMVADDGIGFHVPESCDAAAGTGLRGMRERADLIGATLRVESSPGRGTRLFFGCALADGT